MTDSFLSITSAMQSDNERIDHIEESLNVLVGVIAQTQQQMQTLVAGMTAMRAQLKAQQAEIVSLKQQQGQRESH